MPSARPSSIAGNVIANISHRYYWQHPAASKLQNLANKKRLEQRATSRFINMTESSDRSAYMPSKFGKPIEILGT